MAKLQPFPPVAARLMRMVGTDDVPFRTIADLVRTDTALSTEVLRLANSPLLGRRHQTLNIMHAVAIMGLERLKSLVMMVALRNFLGGALHVPALVRCWRHSLATAFLTRDIGAVCWMDKDQCYTAGLLHDLGRLAMMGTFPSEYADMLNGAADATAASLLDLERKRFEIDHCAVGCWLIAEWDLPEELVSIVGTHHSQLQEKMDMLGAVRAACSLADALGFQVAGPCPEDALPAILGQLSEDIRQKLGAPEDLVVDLAGKINAVECSLLA